MPRPSKRKRKHDQLVFSKIRRNVIATVLLIAVLASITAVVILVPWLFYTPPKIGLSARHYVYSNTDDQLMFDGESVSHLRQQFGKLKNYRAFEKTPDSEIKDTEQPKYTIPENFKASDILIVYLNAHVVVSEQSDVGESVRLLNPDQRPDPTRDLQQDEQFLFDNSQSLANILENIASEKALLKIVLLDAGDFGWSPLTPNRRFNRFAEKLDEYFESIKEDGSFEDFWLITSHASFESSLVLHSDQSTVFAESVSLAIDDYYQASADDKFKKREFSVAAFYTDILKNARRLTRANDGEFLQTPLLFRPGLGVIRQSADAETKSDSKIVFKFESRNDDGKKRFSQRDHSDLKYLADLKSKMDVAEIKSIADRSELSTKFSAQPSQTVQRVDDFLYKNVRMEKSKSKILTSMKLGGVDSSNYSKDCVTQLQYAKDNIRKHETDPELLQAKQEYVEQLRSELFYLTYFSRLADLAIANGLLPSQINGDGGFETYVEMSLKPSTRTLTDREIVKNKLTDSKTFVADTKKYKQEKTDLWKKHFKELTSLAPQSLYVAEQKLFLTALIPAELFPPDPAGDEKKDVTADQPPPANMSDSPSSGAATQRFPSSPLVNQKRAGYRIRFLNRILNEYGGSNVSAMSLAYRGSNETIDGDWSIDRWPLSVDVKQPATADSNSKYDLGIRLATLLGRPSQVFSGSVPVIDWLPRNPGVTLTLNKQNKRLKINLDQFRSGAIQTAINTEDIEKVAIELRVKQNDEAILLSKFVSRPWIRWADSNVVKDFKTLDPNKQTLTITTRKNEDQIDQNDLVIDWAALVTNGRELTAADLANGPVIVEVIPKFDRNDDGTLDADTAFEIEIHFPAPTTLQVNVKNQHFEAAASVKPISEQQIVLNRWQDLGQQDRPVDVQTITTLTNVKSQFSFSLSNLSGRDRLFRCVLYRFIGPQDKDFERQKDSFSGKPEDWYPGNLSEFIREKLRQRIAADPGGNLDKYFQVVGQHESAAAVVATSQPQTADDQELIFKPPAPKPAATGDPPAPAAPAEGPKTISHGMLLLVWELDDAKKPITSTPGWYQFLQFKKKSVRDYFEANDFQSTRDWVDAAGRFRPPINLLNSFAIGENDLIVRKSGPEQKDKLIDPIVLQYANWKPGNETILSSELDNLFKNNDGDSLSFGAINRNDNSVVFLDVMGVPRLYWYNIAKDGVVTDIDADARHFGLQLAESQQVAWKVAYRNGLLDSSGVSSGLRGAVFYRNANVSWVPTDHPAGPRVFLNNKTKVESGMKKPHPAFQVRLFLDQGEESVDGNSIYRVKWKDADQPDLLYHDYSRVFHYDFLDDGKLGFWCDVDDHRVMLDPKTNGSSVFVLERVFPVPFPNDDAPKPVTFLVNQGPANPSPILNVDPDTINLKQEGNLEEELDGATIEFKIGNDQGTVYETAHLVIAEKGNEKPIFQHKEPYPYQAFRNQFANGKPLSLDEFLAQCQPVKDFIAIFRQTDLTGKESVETTLDISFWLEDFFGNQTKTLTRSVKLVLTPKKIVVVKPPPPNPTNVTIFFYYKQELDDAGKPLVPEGEPLNAQHGIKILAMSIGGSKVNIQNWKNREGQTVKIDGKEYQVEKYLNNVINNKKGSPCVVIYGLPPGEYPIVIDVSADFLGSVGEKSKGNRHTVKVVYDEKKKAEEDPQTGRRIPFEQEEKMFFNKKKVK